MNRLRIATRRSPLARWQAEHVAERLATLHAGLDIEVLPMVTQGDQRLDTSLARIGGKGLFIKELEVALLEDRADIAVHSMKDVPAEFPGGLGLAVILAREDPRDALIGAASLAALPERAVVGTASLRRQLQVLEARPDARVRLLRGNVNSRLQKLADGHYDAILLAASGLKRLGMADRIDACLSPTEMLPAVGQGALGIECRLDDTATRALIAPLADVDTSCRVGAERAVGHALGGSCQLPVAAYAELEGREIQLTALVGQPDASRVIRDSIRGPADAAVELGRTLGERLLAAGGREILAHLD